MKSERIKGESTQSSDSESISRMGLKKRRYSTVNMKDKLEAVI